MAVVLLQLSLCVVIVCQLTSSQSTYDVIQQEDVNSCGRTEERFSQLMTAILQLQKDVAELKAANVKDAKGMLYRVAEKYLTG